MQSIRYRGNKLDTFYNLRREEVKEEEEEEEE